ncbi:MAG TPA: DHA2 family efflux MFS transporter permease subunit [Rhizomicrobium sp.]|nr:DHA2 family efflux MFS transporter permease subunit [Rhizomicrobium sp.]
MKQGDVSILPASTDASVSFATWLGFVAMCVGMFMAILDIQVVASSLPAMAEALDIPEDRLSWIQTSYLIAEIIAIPLTGFLTRAISVRWLFAGSTLAFTLASIGCALSDNFAELIFLRTVQGFCGGALIPTVFTTIFVLFEGKREALATTVAGSFAMIAPTLGPALGGWLTETYSWHAIFLINVVPGIIVTAIVAGIVRVGEPDWKLLRHIDYVTVILAAIFLASLELALKEGPKRHWSGTFVWMLLAVCAVSCAFTIQQCLARREPFVNLRRFRDLSFTCGCILSFVLGFGLFSATYMTPVFLGFVRGHTALEIGKIMIVAGAAQLAAAPFAAWLETRIDARKLALAGFAVFAAGLIVNGFEHPRWDFDEFLLPQILRGVAIMFCLLPSTRLALDGWPRDQLSDASALFNLMRNLGGAIGIALVDTVLEQRTEGHVKYLVAQLQAGHRATAQFVGLPLRYFHERTIAPVDEFTKSIVKPLVEKAGVTMSFNEAWLMIGALFVLALPALLLATRARPMRSQPQN